MCCVLGVLAPGCNQSGTETSENARTTLESRMEVELAPVALSDLSASIELVGNFVPHRRTVLVSEVDAVIEKIPERTVEFEGQVFELPLDIGEKVTKGELLVRLDRSEFELQMLVAEASLKKAQKDLLELTEPERPEELRRLRAAVTEAEARCQNTCTDQLRAQKLYDEKAIGKREWERLISEEEAAKAAVERAQATLEKAEKGPTEAEVAVLEAAVLQAEAQVKSVQWKLDRTEIYAPYDAVITDRYVDVGDRVTAMPRVEIMELMDISILSAQVSVPERYINSVTIGDIAEVWPQDATEPVRGVVGRINNKVDAITRTFRIRVGVMNTEGRMRAGQFVRVMLEVKSAAETLCIPRQAVVYLGGQPGVFVYEEGIVHRRTVELGIKTATTVEVLSGLAENDQVVVRDPAVLTDNMPVRVQTSTTVAQATRRTG
jgi:multidrug efflux pump subunit AcrA (membrane-fusion protein)